MLVEVTIFGTSVQCGTFLKVKVDKMLPTKINKKTPMNIRICSPHDNIHRTTHTDVHSSVISRLSTISDSSSLTVLICRRGGKKPRVKNRPKVQRIVDELVNCGSVNQQLLILKEVLRSPHQRKANYLISSSISNSSSNTYKYYPCIFYLMN